MSNNPDVRYSSALDDLMFALLAILGAALLMFKATDLSGAGRYFPLIVCAVMLASGLVILLRAGLQLVRRTATATVTLSRDGMIYGALVLLALVLACVVTPWIGYFPAITFLLVVVPLALHFRRPIPVIATALLFEVMIYLIFIEAFSRRLPSGSLFQ